MYTKDSRGGSGTFDRPTLRFELVADDSAVATAKPLPLLLLMLLTLALALAAVLMGV